MTIRLRTALAATLLLLSGHAAAALQIEVMVFKQPAAEGEGLDWQVAAPLPPCNAVQLRDGGGAESPYNAGGECVKQGDRDQILTGYGTATSTPSLAAAAAKLHAAGQAPLISRAWRQTGALSPVLLSGGADVAGQPQVRGTLVVMPADKYVEVTLDLVLARINKDSGLSEFLRVSETRKMKSGEPHYLDHPLLGAIVQVIDTDASKKPR